ncbi:MAG: tyrosine-type recombinase/integrase [Opitutaceae bacterium]|jgi:site-specific recombinase XerD
MKSTFPELVQRFFGDFLPKQRNVSANTIDSYRHTFRLALPFLAERTAKPIDRLDFDDFNADALLAFLEHLETQRHNTVPTRNVRLAALRSFARYTTVFDAPDRLFSLQQVLAIPVKRCTKPVLGFLNREETTAILEAIKTTQWTGQRDHLFFSLLYNTGARVSELLHFRAEDLRGRVIRLHGKGRKEREVPIPSQLAERLRRWCQSNQIRADRQLFTNLRGTPLSRDGVSFRLSLAVQRAARHYPSLKKRRITPHTFRHTAAMHLLQSGVALEVVALWLGHASPVTTHGYVVADLKMKQECLQQLDEHAAPPKPRRTGANSRLLGFLETV